jgi:topoisomerase-4 subunit A
MTQGIADVSNYNDGLRGGRYAYVPKLLQLIKHVGDYQIPFSTNTTTLIDSILKANEKAKSKSKKLKTIPAAEVEILIHLSQEFLQINQMPCLFYSLRNIGSAFAV